MPRLERLARPEIHQTDISPALPNDFEEIGDPQTFRGVPLVLGGRFQSAILGPARADKDRGIGGPGDRKHGVMEKYLSPDYSAHPLLNPALSESDPSAFRLLYRTYLRILHGTERYNDLLNRMLHVPAEEGESFESNLETARYYLNEADRYMKGLLQILPVEVRATVDPIVEVRDCTDVLELLSMIFMNPHPRTRFEAQRKLYLTKLFFDVDHCRDVLDGAAHKRFFESLLDGHLLSHVTGQRSIEVYYDIGPDGVTMEYEIGGRSRAGQECWSFDLREIDLSRHERPVHLHVYYYSVRFKKEIIPYQYERGGTQYALRPTEIWSELNRRRNGSIISKMIRKGVNDARLIQDLIGAMFIVENLHEVEHLKEFLVDLFGGPFRLKNVVDTLTGAPRAAGNLNPFTGEGYRVFKCEVDVLYRAPHAPDSLPYFFPVEIQIYTLETYLRTIHTEHYASHLALKKRQFLVGLVPYWFPVMVYGGDPVRVCSEEGARVASGGGGTR